MTTQEIKQTLSKVFPEARKIRVRQYPLTYKGTMRGCTDIQVVGVSENYTVFKNKCREALRQPKNTFYSESNY